MAAGHNYNKPLNQRPALRAAAATPVKPSTSDSGWTTHDGYPVPAAAETRDFTRPLGVRPILAVADNDGIPVQAIAAPPEPAIQPTVPPKRGTAKKKQAQAKPVEPVSFSHQTPAKQLLILWHGALVTVAAKDIKYQAPDPRRNIDGWLMVMLPIPGQGGSWLPPAADLNAEDAKIQIPNFVCEFEDKKLYCEHLNIELWNADGVCIVFKAIEVNDD